jgi:3-oxoacyl-(acyl-carrier-protein) synthase
VRRRVVVTGLGAVTPVGNDVATTWQALLDGVSGTAGITKFDPSPFPVRFAAELKGFDPSLYLDRKEIKRADQYTHYAVAAAKQAMRDAGLDGEDAYDPDRIGVIIGSGTGGLKVFEEQHDVYRERGPSKISAFFIPMFITDIAAGIVSMQFNARGPNYATVSACATSAHAIGDAFRTIQYGDADLMICGCGHTHGDRGLREHEGAVRAERLTPHRVPPVRRHARRVRHGRRGGRGDPGGTGACQCARRPHLRRDRGLRCHRRRVSSHCART